MGKKWAFHFLSTTTIGCTRYSKNELHLHKTVCPITTNMGQTVKIRIKNFFMTESFSTNRKYFKLTTGAKNLPPCYYRVLAATSSLLCVTQQKSNARGKKHVAYH